MSTSLPLRAIAYHHASDLPPEFWIALKLNELAANTILPFATKALDFPRDEDQLWIILYDDTCKDVEFVLSCTKGVVGNYPIFIYTPKSPAWLAQEETHLADSMSQLVLRLLNEVPPQRVFSVFAIANVAEKFAEIFEKHTFREHSIRAIGDPYYDGTLVFATNEELTTFPSPPEPEGSLVAVRRANISDLEGLKTLCKGFSYTVPPYLLDDRGAELEARELIADQQVWVYMIKKGEDEWETASFVAATGESDNAIAVTKIFTANKWRGRGCAARLMNYICQEVAQKKKKMVVLYVENSASSAREMFRKVGFRNLDLDVQAGEETIDAGRRWVEIGFEGTTLGFW